MDTSDILAVALNRMPQYKRLRTEGGEQALIGKMIRSAVTLPCINSNAGNEPRARHGSERRSSFNATGSDVVARSVSNHSISNDGSDPTSGDSTVEGRTSGGRTSRGRAGKGRVSEGSSTKGHSTSKGNVEEDNHPKGSKSGVDSGEGSTATPNLIAATSTAATSTATTSTATTSTATTSTATTSTATTSTATQSEMCAVAARADALLAAPSHTSQLLGLLTAAIARPDIVHADDANQDSSSAESASDPEEGEESEQGESTQRQRGGVTTPPRRALSEGSDDAGRGAAAAAARATSSSGTPRTVRPATTHCEADLPPELKAKARDAKELPLAVCELLACGADASAVDADANTPLFLALHIPDIRAALSVIHELLRRGANPNEARRHGATVLHHALALGRAPLVQRLLRNGAYPYRSGSSPTITATGAITSPTPPPRLDAFAAAHGFGPEAEQLMRAALRTAAAGDDLRAARGLLQHGCPADNQLLYTLVRKRRNPKLVRALLAFKADPNTTDKLQTHVCKATGSNHSLPCPRPDRRQAPPPLLVHCCPFELSDTQHTLSARFRDHNSRS